MSVAYQEHKFAYVHVAPAPIQIMVRKPEPPLLPAPKIAGLLPVPKPKPKPMIAGIFANDRIYVVSDDPTYEGLSKQLPDPPCSVIRLKASQMCRVPVKSHFYGDGVIALPAKNRAINVGSQVAVMGFSPHCSVERIFEKWGIEWAEVGCCIARQVMIRTVRLSALEAQP